MSTLAAITLLVLVSPEAPLPPAAGANTVWPSAHAINEAVADDDLPPPGMTKEQREAEATSALDKLESQERSWTVQLVRTILALVAVIGLIYLVFKVVVPRLLGVSLPVKSGKSMRVVERTQLDARHAVVLLEIDHKQRFLVATGERGVQLLADLSRPGLPTKDGRADFKAMLERSGTATVTPEEESDGKS